MTLLKCVEEVCRRLVFVEDLYINAGNKHIIRGLLASVAWCSSQSARARKRAREIFSRNYVNDMHSL